MKIIKKYLAWLQHGNPTGEVEKFPSINSFGETSVPGIFVAGDLTGIPLLKLAAESGKTTVQHITNSSEFTSWKSRKQNDDTFDLIIIGAGPAGLAAGIEAQERGLHFLILESAQSLSTILNFPKGKPIIAAPAEFQQKSPLIINNGTKESLLQDIKENLAPYQLPVCDGVSVSQIKKSGNLFQVHTPEKQYQAFRVILAIGKSGNSRMLNVTGEQLPKVFNRLIDPADATGHDVIVAGGGDSALETAIAVAGFAKSVSLVYRNKEFSRPKNQNIQTLRQLQQEGKITVFLESTIEKINDSTVTLNTPNGTLDIANSMVFSMIGKELPVSFFKKSGIEIEGELSLTAKLQFLFLFLFSAVLYFGKSSLDFILLSKGTVIEEIGFFSIIPNFEVIKSFFVLPAVFLTAISEGSITKWNISGFINSIIAYVSFIFSLPLGLYLFADFCKKQLSALQVNWKFFKNIYFIFVAVFIIGIFFSERYIGIKFLGKSQSFWYTALYSVTIIIFGFRRMKMKPTKYIQYQTLCLMVIQVLPLFVLPELLLPYAGKMGWLGNNDGFILSQIFPGNSYWRSYGFVLAWPLNFSNLYNSNITAFWFIFSIVQTFIVIPLLVYKWGKGAYCGWICSCGALAETLGDDYRSLAPHGVRAKKWENTGQFILAGAFLLTAMKLIAILYNINIPYLHTSLNDIADYLHKVYYIGVDVIFAGVLGVGVYFFMSGRIWCRFGCPLAAWMHIINKFSQYRILSEKKKCISCNICTKVCHMGIDVMNYANKGIPMNDVECVRCSACVVNCPTQVLSFGSIKEVGGNDSSSAVRNITIRNFDWRNGL